MIFIVILSLSLSLSLSLTYTLTRCLSISSPSLSIYIRINNNFVYNLKNRKILERFQIYMFLFCTVTKFYFDRDFYKVNFLIEINKSTK